MRAPRHAALVAGLVLCVEALGPALVATAAVESAGRWPLHEGPLDFAIYFHSATALASGRSPLTPGAFDPPTFSLLLAPLVPLGLPAAYAIFTLVSLGIAVSGLWLCAGRARLHPTPLLVAAGIVWYPVVQGLVLGKSVPLVLGLLLIVLFLLSRDRLAGAGLLSGLLWMKPDMTVPILLAVSLGITVWLPSPRRFLLPFAAASAAFFAVEATSFVPWIHAVLAAAQTVVSQPYQVSLTAALQLVQAGAPLAHLRWVLMTLKVLVAACAAAALAASFRRLPPRRPGWASLAGWERLWWTAGIVATTWMIVAPYTQLYDEALVLPVILAAARHGIGRGRGRTEATFLLLLAVPLLTAVTPAARYLLPVANMALLAWAWQQLTPRGTVRAEIPGIRGTAGSLTS